jgi:hypothetical protein
MALNPQFISISDLVSYFVDKDTGEALAGGTVEFYQDKNRIVPKNVFILSGDAGNPTYTNIGAVVSLGTDGTPEYLNNKVTIYYWPFEGDPDTAPSTTPEYYFVRILSAGAVEQKTVEAVPNVVFSDDNLLKDEKNFANNSQFLGFNNEWQSTMPVAETDGAINFDTYSVAPGGWEFGVEAADVAKYDFTFTRPASPPGSFNNYPYGEVRWVNTVSPTGTIHDFRLKLQDVYKLASPLGQQTYTFYLAGQSGDGSNHTFDVFIIKNYGTGGGESAPEYTNIGAITFTPSSAYETITINVDPIVGKTVGPNNDDFFAIALRQQTAASFDVKMFEAGLFLGAQIVAGTALPPVTLAQQRAEGIAGWMPTPAVDGSDLYLPLRLTPAGLEFDDSEVGMVKAATTVTPPVGYLNCDGTAYRADQRSADGIPYSRLLNKMWSPGNLVSVFGTGREAPQSLRLAVATNDYIMIHNNDKLAVTAPIADTGGTGMTMGVINAGNGSPTFTSYANRNNVSEVFVFDKVKGSYPTAPATGTTTWGPNQVDVRRDDNETLPITFILPTIAPLLPASPVAKYFELSSPSLIAPAFYYIWMPIDGVGTDPAPANGIGLRLNVDSNWTDSDLATAIVSLMNGYEASQVQTLAAAAIPESSYFTFYSGPGPVANQQYYVWYNKGAGVDPAVVGAIGIEVVLDPLDAADVVATKTITAINRANIGAPDLRGMFIRGQDVTSENDPTADNRLSYQVFNADGDELGTYQFDTNVAHIHNAEIFQYQSGGATPEVVLAGGGNPPTILGTAQVVRVFTDGNEQAVPRNVYLNYVIKY